jgi:hypothetical protein
LEYRTRRLAIGVGLLVVAAAIVVVAEVARGPQPQSAAVTTSGRIQHWLFDDTTLIGNHLATLSNWMTQSNNPDPALASVPYTALLTDPGLEADRARAIADLAIP